MVLYVEAQYAKCTGQVGIETDVLHCGVNSCRLCVVDLYVVRNSSWANVVRHVFLCLNRQFGNYVYVCMCGLWCVVCVMCVCMYMYVHVV